MATTVTLKPNAIDLSGSTSGTTTLQATAVAGTTTITLPAATDTLVGKATTDTLTNKTLTTPVISTISNTGTLTLPTSTDTLVGRATTDTLTNKTLTTPVISSLSSATATALTLQSAGTTAVTIDTSQNVGIGTTSPATKLQVAGGRILLDNAQTYQSKDSGGTARDLLFMYSSNDVYLTNETANNLLFRTNATERMRIDSSGNLLVNTTTASSKFCVNAEMSLLTDGNNRGIIGWDNTDKRISFGTINASTAYFNAMSLRDGNLLVAKTASSFSTAGFEYDGTNKQLNLTTSGNSSLRINRTTNDGVLVSFQQDASEEGTISVSGTTVSYNGGHLSRYAQTTTAKDNSLVKGTVLSNLDAMNVYTDAEGNPVPNEQLNKVKVSDVEGDANVAGVFVNWTYDEAHQVDEINMAMTGDMIIRIAQGITVQRGDLLMSAGDGTAKPQGDDIVRSKTIAKVTSNHVTCTYADGSFCVPCVLMAC